VALTRSLYLRGGYDGVEIHPDAVAWCQQAITSRYPGFRFHRADLTSRAYHPRGRQPSSTYRLPFPDRWFDFVLLYSVLTHMLPDDVEHYVREISRVPASGGVCVASYFLLNDESRGAIDAGCGFMSFDALHPSGLCRLHDPVVPEAAVALEETFVRRVHQQAGLQLRAIRQGSWWNGIGDGHDVLAATSAAPKDLR
jgi:SAM-dependent methyltransferase